VLTTAFIGCNKPGKISELILANSIPGNANIREYGNLIKERNSGYHSAYSMRRGVHSFFVLGATEKVRQNVQIGIDMRVLRFSRRNGSAYANCLSCTQLLAIDASDVFGRVADKKGMTPLMVSCLAWQI
jgi:hypothetical protein